MSVQLMAQVFQASIGSPTDKLVLLALADFADGEGGSIYPSLATLAAKCDLTERACRFALRRLEAGGLLLVEREAKHHRTRRYRILIETLGGLRGERRSPLQARGGNHVPPSRPVRGERRSPLDPQPAAVSALAGASFDDGARAPSVSTSKASTSNNEPSAACPDDAPAGAVRAGGSGLVDQARLAQQERFDTFWEAFPKRASKGLGTRTEAWWWWRQIEPTAREARAIVAALRRAEWPYFYSSLGEVQVDPAAFLQAWAEEHRPVPDAAAVVRPRRLRDPAALVPA